MANPVAERISPKTWQSSDVAARIQQDVNPLASNQTRKHSKVGMFSELANHVSHARRANALDEDGSSRWIQKDQGNRSGAKKP